MAHLNPPARHRDQHGRDVPNGRDAEREVSDVAALREENAELRRLVIELSKLVIRNVVEQR
jgi:hypothetical protein